MRKQRRDCVCDEFVGWWIDQLLHDHALGRKASSLSSLNVPLAESERMVLLFITGDSGPSAAEMMTFSPEDQDALISGMMEVCVDSVHAG